MQSQGLKKYKLPGKSGVYLFKKGKENIYIGKATSLKDRVKSYFGKDLIQTRGPLLVDMIFQADKIDWIETDSVLEALILEASLIKKHQPKYNTKEKSNKSFNYVCITKDSFPKVLIIRERGISKEIKYQAKFGPFTNGTQLRDAMKIIRPIFPYIDAQSAKRDNFEFYRQLGLTPDVGNKELEIAYKKNIINLKLFFQGKKKRILFNLKKEMNLYAKDRKFERANDIKKRIFALNHINDVALLRADSFASSGFRIEAYDIAHMSGKNMVGVMTVAEDGEVAKSEYKKFIIRTQSTSNDTGALEEVLLRRFRHTEWGMPNLIVLDGSVAQLNVAKRVLRQYQFDIPMVAVVKDDRHKAKAILGEESIIKFQKKAILLANSEAHRFAITFHKLKRGKSFLGAS